jgi:hypothetical protein
MSRRWPLGWSAVALAYLLMSQKCQATQIPAPRPPQPEAAPVTLVHPCDLSAYNTCMGRLVCTRAS